MRQHFAPTVSLSIIPSASGMTSGFRVNPIFQMTSLSEKMPKDARTTESWSET